MNKNGPQQILYQRNYLRYNVHLQVSLFVYERVEGMGRSPHHGEVEKPQTRLSTTRALAQDFLVSILIATVTFPSSHYS